MADNDNARKVEFENKCSVPGCRTVKSEESNSTLFSVPKRVRSTPDIRNHWLGLFRLPCNKFPSIFNICEKHFEESDIVKHDSEATLLPRAVPVHNLPDENTPLEDYNLFDDGEGDEDSSSDDYPQSIDSVEKVAEPAPIVTMEEQIEEFHDAIEDEVKEPETPSGMEAEVAPEEKVYHDLKPHITGEEDEEILPTEPVTVTFTPNITNLAAESVKLDQKEPEEKVLKVIKRVAPVRNVVEEEDEEESPNKRPRRNVIHKLIKPRKEPNEPQSTPEKKVVVKPQVVLVKNIIKTPMKVVKKEDKTPTKQTVVKVSPKVTPKVIVAKTTITKVVPPKLVTPKVVPSKAVTPKPVTPKVVATPKVVVKSMTTPKVIAKPIVAPKIVLTATPKMVSKTPIPKKEEKKEPDNNGAASSRSRRNVVHKLIKPRVETPVQSTPTKTESKPSSPRIVMISPKLIVGSPKFVKSPQILKLSPQKITSPVIVTPKKPTVLPKVAVKRLTSKIIPVEDDSSRPRRNVPHKFIKTNNNKNGVEKKEDKKTTPQAITPETPKKPTDPVESMHVALLKEFLSDSKRVQMEVVKKKATSIAKIIGLKGFKASDDWTKNFIAGNLATCNGGSAN